MKFDFELRATSLVSNETCRIKFEIDLVSQVHSCVCVCVCNIHTLMALKYMYSCSKANYAQKVSMCLHFTSPFFHSAFKTRSFYTHTHTHVPIVHTLSNLDFFTCKKNLYNSLEMAGEK